MFKNLSIKNKKMSITHHNHLIKKVINRTNKLIDKYILKNYPIKIKKKDIINIQTTLTITFKNTKIKI